MISGSVDKADGESLSVWAEHPEIRTATIHKETPPISPNFLIMVYFSLYLLGKQPAHDFVVKGKGQSSGVLVGKAPLCKVILLFYIKN